MQQVEGNYKADDGKDYYELALNIQTGDKLLIKNAGCLASAEFMAMDFWNIPEALFATRIIRIFYLGDSSEIKKSRIPKKYHKLVF